MKLVSSSESVNAVFDIKSITSSVELFFIVNLGISWVAKYEKRLTPENPAIASKMSQVNIDVNPNAKENHTQTRDTTPKRIPYIKSVKVFLGKDKSVLEISFILII